MNMSRDGGLEHNLIFIVAVAALLPVLVIIATRACLESLVCLLLMIETICLAFYYEQSWPVVWTRVTVLQIFVAAALFFLAVGSPHSQTQVQYLVILYRNYHRPVVCSECLYSCGILESLNNCPPLHFLTRQCRVRG